MSQSLWKVHHRLLNGCVPGRTVAKQVDAAKSVLKGRSMSSSKGSSLPISSTTVLRMISCACYLWMECTTFLDWLATSFHFVESTLPRESKPAAIVVKLRYIALVERISSCKLDIF